MKDLRRWKAGALLVAALLIAVVGDVASTFAAPVSSDAPLPTERVLVDSGILGKRYLAKFQRVKSELADFSRNDRWGGGWNSAKRDATLTGKAFFAFCVAADQGVALDEAPRLLAPLSEEANYKFSKSNVYARYLAVKHLLNEESGVDVASRARGLRDVVAATTYKDVEGAEIDENAAPFVYVCAPNVLRDEYETLANKQFGKNARFYFNVSRQKERIVVACNPRLKMWIAWTICGEKEANENFYWVSRGSEYWGRYRPTVKPTPEELAEIRRAVSARNQRRKERERELKIARNAERRERAFYRNEARWARHNALLAGARPLQFREAAPIFGGGGAYPVGNVYAPASLSGGKIWVDEYYRQDGTRVSGHWRSKPSR